MQIHCAKKIFGKIYLKAIRDTFFFQRCDQRSDGGIRFFGEGDIQQKKKVQTFRVAGRPPSLPPPGSPNFEIWILLKDPWKVF